MDPLVQQRPADVSVLAMLSMTGGVFWFVTLLFHFAVYLAFGGPLTLLDGPTGISQGAVVCSGIVIVIGVLNIFVGWGLWLVQGWAWTPSAIFAFVGLVNIPIGTVISVIALWYLSKPEIRAVFGKGPPAVEYRAPHAYPRFGPPSRPQRSPLHPSSPPTSPPAAPAVPSAPPTPGARTCGNCAAFLQADQKFCPACGAKVEQPSLGPDR